MCVLASSLCLLQHAGYGESYMYLLFHKCWRRDGKKGNWEEETNRDQGGKKRYSKEWSYWTCSQVTYGPTKVIPIPFWNQWKCSQVTYNGTNSKQKQLQRKERTEQVGIIRKDLLKKLTLVIWFQVIIGRIIFAFSVSSISSEIKHQN